MILFFLLTKKTAEEKRSYVEGTKGVCFIGIIIEELLKNSDVWNGW